MDSQTRHALKQDKFVQTTQSGVSWVGEHRSSVIRFSVALVVVLALLIAGLVYYNQRSEAAESALGAALDTYGSQLAQPGAPAAKGVFTSAGDRAKAANQQFLQVANQYGWLAQGAKAHFFVQPLGLIHAGEGFEVTGLIAEAARDAQTMSQQHRPHALAARRAQKVHLAQLAHLEIPARQWRDPCAADDFAALLEDEIGRARRAVGLRHAGDFRILQCEAWPAGAEFRHDAPDERRDRRVVAGRNESDKMRRVHESYASAIAAMRQ